MNLSVSPHNERFRHVILESTNDARLILAARAGDAAAFSELRRRHHSKILLTVYRITRNWEDAEDAVQDSFLRVFLRLNTFENRSTFASWLTRIAINSAFMIMRKRRPREISIDCANEDPEAVDGWDLRDFREDPEHSYLRKERKELLKSAISSLRPAFRDVVELQQSREYSTRELAQVLGISLPAAKSRLMRARAALRASLQ